LPESKVKIPVPRLRYPKSARLSRASEFARLRREGSSFHGKLIVLSVLRIQPPESTRVGIITSRRVGGSVERHRVRRRLRELLRVSLPDLENGVWIALIARAGAARATFAELRDDWLRVAHKSVILRESCG
jgi:ribonuclease P protein component